MTFVNDQDHRSCTYIIPADCQLQVLNPISFLFRDCRAIIFDAQCPDNELFIEKIESSIVTASRPSYHAINSAINIAS